MWGKFKSFFHKWLWTVPFIGTMICRDKDLPKPKDFIIGTTIYPSIVFLLAFYLQVEYGEGFGKHLIPMCVVYCIFIIGMFVIYKIMEKFENVGKPENPSNQR